jgi:DNA-binding GntR family transcriptional regulator
MVNDIPEHIYVQIADDLAEKIADGTYAPGSRLPSLTELATAYGHHRLTIRRAIEDLRARQLVHTVHGLGNYVLPLEPGPARE